MSASSFHDSFTPDVSRALAADSAWPDKLGFTEARRQGFNPTRTPVTIIDNTEPLPAREWADRAACVGRTDEMFPKGAANSRAFKAALANAVAICNTCPVKAECGDFAERTKQTDGVWGGVLYNGPWRSKKPFRELVPITHGTVAGWKKHYSYPDIYGPPCDECTQAKTKANGAYKKRNRADRRAHLEAKLAEARGESVA